jgi:hypothetical protein
VSRLASWTVERSPAFPDYFLLRNAASGLLLYKDLQTGLVRAGNIPPDSRNAAWFFQLNDKRRQGVGGNEYRIVNLWDNSFIGRPCGSLPPNADPLALLTDTNECWNWHAWSVTYMHKYTQREAVIEWFDAAQYALPPPPVSPPGRPVAPPAPIAATPAPTPRSAPPPAANAAFANTCWLAIAQSHRYDTIDDERWFATKTNMLGGVILFELAPPSAAGDVLMGWGAAPRPPFGLIPDGTGGFSDEATALWFQPDGIASLQIEDPRDPGRSILYRLYRVPLADDSMRVQYTTWYTDDISGTAMRHSGYGPNMDLESCNRLQEGL